MTDAIASEPAEIAATLANADLDTEILAALTLTMAQLATQLDFIASAAAK
jgi:hypothetical protein